MEIVRIINSVFESNSYLIVNDENKICFLIDCGEADIIINSILKSGLSLKGIFITHSHFDHIYGLNSVIGEYPEVPVYTSVFGQNGLCSDKLNLSRYNLDPYVFQYPDNIKVVGNGDRVVLWKDVILEIFETPGHDESCLTYKIADNLFTGDSFIPGLKVVASFPHSNKIDAEMSRQRILSLAERINLYPGHGENYEKFQLLSAFF